MFALLSPDSFADKFTLVVFSDHIPQKPSIAIDYLPETHSYAAYNILFIEFLSTCPDNLCDDWYQPSFGCYNHTKIVPGAGHLMAVNECASKAEILNFSV